MIENINDSLNTILMNKAAKIREDNNVITKQPHKEIKDNNINDDHNPAYYANMPVQPINLIRSILTPEELIGYLKGNAIKYAMRAGKKPHTDDKAKFETYSRWLKEEKEKKPPSMDG